MPDEPGRPEPRRGAADLRDRRTLVLGATGFLGRRVARRAGLAGAQVHAAVRDPERAAEALSDVDGAIRIHAVDLGDEAAVGNLLRSIRPEIVLDLSGYGVGQGERDPSVAERINAKLPEWVARHLPIEPARDVEGGRGPWGGVRILRAGSAQEAGDVNGSFREDAPCHPTTLYGRTKLAGTIALARVARERGLSAATARLFTVFGPGERPERLFPSLLRAARRAETLALTTGSQERDFLFVDDAAEAFVRLAGAAPDPGEVVHIASGRLTSVRVFALGVARLLGMPEERLRFGELPARNEEQAHGPVSIERFAELCGRSPPSDLGSALARAVRASDSEQLLVSVQSLARGLRP
jgi:nucleoside-diphosphate-sugar epimerase